MNNYLDCVLNDHDTTDAAKLGLLAALCQSLYDRINKLEKEYETDVTKQ